MINTMKNKIKYTLIHKNNCPWLSTHSVTVVPHIKVRQVCLWQRSGNIWDTEVWSQLPDILSSRRSQQSRLERQFLPDYLGIML